MCEKPSTWYEDERSRILYTCEEQYDGNMVRLVIDLESQMAKLKLERDYLLKLVNRHVACDECVHKAKPHDNPICRSCGILAQNWEWRGLPDEKGSDQA